MYLMWNDTIGRHPYKRDRQPPIRRNHSQRLLHTQRRRQHDIQPLLLAPDYRVQDYYARGVELDLLARHALPLAVPPARIVDELREAGDGLAVHAMGVGKEASVLGVKGGAAELHQAGVLGVVGVHPGRSGAGSGARSLHDCGSRLGGTREFIARGTSIQNGHGKAAATLCRWLWWNGQTDPYHAAPRRPI